MSIDSYIALGFSLPLVRNQPIRLFIAMNFKKCRVLKLNRPVHNALDTTKSLEEYLSVLETDMVLAKSFFSYILILGFVFILFDKYSHFHYYPLHRERI